MISGRVLGSQQVRAKIASVREDIPNLLSRQRLGDFLIKRMQDRFLRQKDPDGNTWRALSVNTTKGIKPLYKTGNLLKSISVIDGNPKGIFASATGAGFRIGIKSIRYTETYARSSRTVDTSVYGRVQQLGNSHVPQRKFIGIGAADKKAIGDLLRREMKKALGGTGG